MKNQIILKASLVIVFLSFLGTLLNSCETNEIPPIDPVDPPDEIPMPTASFEIVQSQYACDLYGPGTVLFLQASITVENNSQEATTYLWDFGDGTTSTETNPGLHEYAQAGDYTLQLIAENDQGKKDTMSEQITVLQTSQFEKSYGADLIEHGQAIVQTQDANYALLGEVIDAPIGQSSDEFDISFMKVDTSGQILWETSYGNPGTLERGNHFVQTLDGGYVIVGNTNSKGAGSDDILLLKYSANGGLMWEKTYGTNLSDLGHSIMHAADGGFLFTARTENTATNFWDSHFYKVNGSGDLIWQKTFTNVLAGRFIESSSGGFVMIGFRNRTNGTDSEVYLLKVNSSGEEEWSQSYGGSGEDTGVSLIEASNGGYYLLGYTNSFGNGGLDIYIIKVSANGGFEWQKTIGGTRDDTGVSLYETTNNDLIILANTNSWGSGELDVYLLRVPGTSQDSIVWSTTFGAENEDVARSFVRTCDGSYSIYGYNQFRGLGQSDFYHIKTRLR